MHDTPTHLRRLAVSHHPRRSLSLCSLILLLITLAACQTQPRSGGESSVTPPAVTSTPTIAPTPTPTPPPRVLYVADWSHNLAAWHLSAGWSIAGGALRSDGGANCSFTIPYRPTGPNYAIQMNLELVRVLPTNGSWFLLSAPVTASQNGFDVYISNLGALNRSGSHNLFDYPQAWLTLNPLDDQDPKTTTSHDYSPVFRPELYDIEVTGPSIVLNVNSHITAWAVSLRTPTLSTGPLQFSCANVVLRISSLRIVAP